MEQTSTIGAHARNAVIILGLTAVLQAGHMVEHVAQFVQWMLHLRQAKGLIGEFDLEPIHLGFNFGLLIGLSLLGSFYDDVMKSGSRAAYAVFVSAWAVQTYHCVEHVVKYAQYVETGLQGTPGILGRYIAPIPMHFVLNLIVTVGTAAPFFMLGMHRTLLRLVPSLRRRGA